MKHGLCQIELIKSEVKDGVTFYHLKLTHQGQQFLVNQRYSKLRMISMTLPEISTPFPPPQHLEKIMSQLVGNEKFQTQRYNKLQIYFKSVSQANDLKNSQGFQWLLVSAKAMKQQEEEPESVPAAPVLKGKKLLMRKTDEKEALLIY